MFIIKVKKKESITLSLEEVDTRKKCVASSIVDISKTDNDRYLKGSFIIMIKYKVVVNIRIIQC